MYIHLFVYKCVCVRGEAAARTAGGPLHRQGRPHVARVGSHHHHLPPTSWISRCLSHSGPRQPPAPPARSREHSQFTLCLLTLVTFTADELFVVLPQPTRLKHPSFHGSRCGMRPRPQPLAMLGRDFLTIGRRTFFQVSSA